MYVVIFFLICLQLVGLSLLSFYGHISAKHLKQQAALGDKEAKKLYRVSVHSLEAKFFLWGLVGLTSAGLYISFIRTFNSLVAYLLVTLSIWIGFAWLPTRKTHQFSRKIALFVSPLLLRFLGGLYHFFRFLRRFIKTTGRAHTGLYEKTDLLEIIRSQKKQKDNNISKEALEIAEHSLQFDSKIIRDYMTPRRVVDMVSADDAISTHLLNDLHKRGRSRYPVYNPESQDNVVGVLYLKSLVGVRESGTVRTYMNKEVFYVHEEGSLVHALDAFLKTEHHLFIVVNIFEEIVGIITIEDILEQIIGKQIIDEFDQYDNMRAVAELVAKKEHQERKETTSSDPTEVIE